MKIPRRLAALGVLSLAAVLSLYVTACGAGEASTSPPGAGTAAHAGQQAAPDFSGTTIDGEQVSLAGFAGKPTILVFWASW
jgi:cytochrome oxidase Cu insertion factor (SCO1/SenC/PrrC family)